MYSIETIRHLQRKAASEAARHKRKPFIVRQEDIDDWTGKLNTGHPVQFPFPFIGTYTATGYTATGETLFCDASGFGAENEPALTPKQLLLKLKPGFAYAVIEVGQFQVVVGEYAVQSSIRFQPEAALQEQ